MNWFRTLTTLLLGLSAWTALENDLWAQPAQGEGKSPPAATLSAGLSAFRAPFLKLCDLAACELDKEITVYIESRYRQGEDPRTHHVPFFEDSYGVRALAVAYDMTGEKKYLDACTRWADCVVACQQRMVPKGAYFPNYDYGRQPGQEKGGWYVADSGSIGMGVLAVAVRTRDAQRQRYLDSVPLLRPAGHRQLRPQERRHYRLACGRIPTSGGARRPSSGADVPAHDETNDPEYLKVALGAADWLNRHDFHKEEKPAFEALNPCMVFYCFEFYATALPHLKPGSPRSRRPRPTSPKCFNGWPRTRKAAAPRASGIISTGRPTCRATPT